MTKLELIVLARSAAAAQALDPALVCAIVEQESDWNPWALRFEPMFLAKYVLPLAQKQRLSVTESNARATSWGLMQVMGQVAREQGFAAASLAELCEPATGLQMGCHVFSTKLAAADGNQERALLLWNGGANQWYGSEVLARIGSYK